MTIENIKSFLQTLTHQPGVYKMLGSAEEILYVGKARDLKKRVASYFIKNKKDIKTLALLNKVQAIEVIATHSENEALLLESNLIKEHKPHYNVVFRDDKSYPYILISTNHPFPSIDFYRGSKKVGGRYFGPYPSAYAVRETINLIQKLFQLRTCTESFYSTRKRPCLHYQIGRCVGPCVGLVSEIDYKKNVEHAILFLEGKSELVIKDLEKQMEKASESLNFELAVKFRDQITRVRQIQEKQYVNTTQPDTDIIGCHIQAGIACIQLFTIRHGQMLGNRSYFPNIPMDASLEDILAAFITQHYLANSNMTDVPKELIVEKKLSDHAWFSNALSEHYGHKVIVSTPQRGERKKWLAVATMNAKQAVVNKLMNKINMQERFNAFYKELSLEIIPKWIECFDVSHSMGEETVASCVLFGPEGPLKNGYRRFNIKGIAGGDDIAAMEQALTRHFKKINVDSNYFPDVVLIDGGKAQLHVAEKVLDELGLNIILIGVAKGATRKPGFETLHISHKKKALRESLVLPPDSLALHLIQQIRDEAHRFAITGHRLRRDKKRRTSTLETIAGIGAKRRRELLRYFGGIQGLNRASLEEISKVPGVNQILAERIFSVLHPSGEL